MRGADMAVNLVGSFDGDLMRLMGTGAGNVARAAADEGVTSLVQVSAIGADAQSPSAYAQAKAAGEHEVRERFPQATILRPSILLGEEGGIVPLLAGLVSKWPVLPVFAPNQPMQPLFVGDAAEAVVAALGDAASYGSKTYEIAGPQQLTMLELHRQIVRSQGRRRHLLELPDNISGLLAKLPLVPMSADQWEMLKRGNIPSGQYPGLAELGVEARPLALFLDRWMTRYRRFGRFAERLRAA